MSKPKKQIDEEFKLSNQVVPAGSHHYDDDGFYLWNGTEDLWGNNTTITRVRVDETITVIPSLAFHKCSNLKEVQLPIGLIRLEDRCFRNCKSLKRICLPKSIQEIGEWAFSNSGLEEVIIPPLVTEIEEGVFCGCELLLHVQFHESVTRIGQESFAGCSSLEEVKIPPRVTQIEEEVFHHCESLVQAELHENVTHIGEGSFDGCSSLKNIQLPSSLREIGSWAFYNCGLEQISLSSNVSLGLRAFGDCKQLTKIISPPHSIGRIEDHLFVGCPNICALYLPKTAETEFDAAEQKLITELCRTEGQSATDRLGIGWMEIQMLIEKDPDSTVETTCLFSFLKQNDFRVLKNKRQNQGSDRNRS